MFAGCLLAAGVPADGPAPGGPAAAGAAHVAPFKQALMSTLAAALASGPEAAIAVCREEAPRLASSAAAPGVRLGRTSDRLRNPGNRAPAWVEPVLAAYRADAEHAAPRTVELGADRLGYVEPIRIQPLCLTCHGETPAPAVRERLAALYPSDRATGYRLGDLRGVFWAEFPR